jgi:DNA-binding transcriptional ArsR family regulator
MLTLNQMVHQSDARLDAAFAALSDATRRGVLEELGRAETSITRLADRFAMTPTGMKKHVALLEDAGLVTTEKQGRVRVCRLESQGLGDIAAWLEARRAIWNTRFDALDSVIRDLHPQGAPR